MTSSTHRRRFLILGIAIVLVIGGAVVLLLRGGDDDASASGLSDVVTYPDLDRDHVAGEVQYPQSPPVGGEHDPIWLNCGVYDRPVREENAVHSLEHGAVWITYQPGLSAEEIDNLAAKLPEKGILYRSKTRTHPWSSPSGGRSSRWTGLMTRDSTSSSSSTATGTLRPNPRRRAWAASRGSRTPAPTPESRLRHPRGLQRVSVPVNPTER